MNRWNKYNSKQIWNLCVMFLILKFDPIIKTNLVRCSEILRDSTWHSPGLKRLGGSSLREAKSEAPGCRATSLIIEVHVPMYPSFYPSLTYPLECLEAGERFQWAELWQVPGASRWASVCESSSTASKPEPKPQLQPLTPVSAPFSDDITDRVWSGSVGLSSFSPGLRKMGHWKKT